MLNNRDSKIKNENKTKKEKIVDFLDLPRDIMLNIPIIHFEGRDIIQIENYKGIIEYNDEQIRLNTTIGVIKIIGKSLYIKSITSEEIIINGCFKSLSFLN